jgi:hypothetical protein
MKDQSDFMNYMRMSAGHFNILLTKFETNI